MRFALLTTLAASAIGTFLAINAAPALAQDLRNQHVVECPPGSPVFVTHLLPPRTLDGRFLLNSGLEPISYACDLPGSLPFRLDLTLSSPGVATKQDAQSVLDAIRSLRGRKIGADEIARILTVFEDSDPEIGKALMVLVHNRASPKDIPSVYELLAHNAEKPGKGDK